MTSTAAQQNRGARTITDVTQRLSTFVLPLALVAAPLAAQQPRSVSLADAIAMAQRVQPTTVQAEGAIRTANAQKLAAYGEFMPTISYSASAGTSYTGLPAHTDANGQVTNSNTSNTFSNGLSANIDLFTGFRRGADVAAASASQQAADAGLVNARYQVALTTTQAFITALTQAELVTVDSEALDRALAQLQVAANKLRVGAATRSDSLTALVAVGTARLNLVNARSQLAAGEAALARLIGITGRVTALDDSSFHRVVEAIDTTQIRHDAAAQSPMVQSADANATAAHAALRASRSAYSPTLSLGAGLNWGGSFLGQAGLNTFPSRSLRLSLNWPLFNGFTRERTVTDQDVAAANADATAEDTRRQLDASVTQYLAQLDAARQNIDISQTSVVSAQEALRVVQDRYRAGAATIVDIQVAQDALNTAEVSILQARFSYLTAKAQIEALIGRSL